MYGLLVYGCRSNSESDSAELCRRREGGKECNMEVQSAVDLAREALTTALLIGAPILLVGVGVGLIISLAQALTQIQDQTISFVPKIVTMVLALVMCLPWLIQRMMTYSENLITNIPQTLLGG